MRRRDRARNLSLIHEVIEQVIGLTDLREISQIAAELMAHYFAYELAVIALIEGPDRNIAITGIGGNAAELVQQGLSYMDEAKRDGIVMRVIATGQNMLVNDSSQNPFFRPIPNWDARSEMCVALKDSDQIIGVINVESQRRNAFSQNDFIVLEALAGILKTDILSAVVGQGLKLTVIGVVVGLAGAVALTRILSSLLYDVTATDPLTLVFVSLILAAIALLASYLPARRAARIDP